MYPKYNCFSPRLLWLLDLPKNEKGYRDCRDITATHLLHHNHLVVIECKKRMCTRQKFYASAISGWMTLTGSWSFGTGIDPVPLSSRIMWDLVVCAVSVTARRARSLTLQARCRTYFTIWNFCLMFIQHLLRATSWEVSCRDFNHCNHSAFSLTPHSEHKASRARARVPGRCEKAEQQSQHLDFLKVFARVLKLYGPMPHRASIYNLQILFSRKAFSPSRDDD